MAYKGSHNIKEPAPIICEKCEKVFYGKKAFICPDCLRVIASERAKRIGLNKMGNEAYSKKQAERKAGNG